MDDNLTHFESDFVRAVLHENRADESKRVVFTEKVVENYLEAQMKSPHFHHFFVFIVFFSSTQSVSAELWDPSNSVLKLFSAFSF